MMNISRHIKETRTTNNFFRIFLQEIIRHHQDIDTSRRTAKLWPESFAAKDIQPDIRPIPKLIQPDIHQLLKKGYVFFPVRHNIELYLYGAKNMQEEYDICNKVRLLINTLLSFESPSNCFDHVRIFIFLTNHLKEYNWSSSPETTIHEYHVNTGFTFGCSPHNQIVIYRREEWFKVLIHECFHAFGWDFRHANDDDVRKIYCMKINNFRLYESYTETWAEILNILFQYYDLHPKKMDERFAISQIRTYLKKEIEWSIRQCVKILQIYHISYDQLVAQIYDVARAPSLVSTRECKEVKDIISETCVAEYYIIKSVLLYHYHDFIYWCSIPKDVYIGSREAAAAAAATNKDPLYSNMESPRRWLFSFYKHHSNVQDFIRFIQKCVKNKIYEKRVIRMENTQKKRLYRKDRKNRHHLLTWKKSLKRAEVIEGDTKRRWTLRMTAPIPYLRKRLQQRV